MTLRVNKNAVRMTAAVLALVLLAPASALLAQRQPQHIFLPNVSPRAEVAQTVGVTEIRVVYHRPAVNERDVWGALVPFGAVWRTGANENTLISFSTDVKVQGEDLAAGTYGLHTLPGEEEWQVIFSNDTTAWGSFSYNEETDALRVKATPEAAGHVERMQFSIDDPGNDSATVALRWAELRVPVSVEVDTATHARASIDEQLKGLSQFFWNGWNQAANYALNSDTDLEEALGWADRSIGIEKRFNNLATKAQILEKLERADEAETVMAEALPIGNAGNLHNYARQLIGREMKEEALEVFQRNVDQNPDAWFVELGLARGYSALGRFEEAATAMKVSLEKAPEPQKTYVQGLVDQLEAGEDIN